MWQFVALASVVTFSCALIGWGLSEWRRQDKEDGRR